MGLKIDTIDYLLLGSLNKKKRLFGIKDVFMEVKESLLDLWLHKKSDFCDKGYIQGKDDLFNIRADIQHYIDVCFDAERAIKISKYNNEFVDVMELIDSYTMSA